MSVEEEQFQPKINVRQWDLITFCEQFWHENKTFPSYEEIASEVSHYTKDLAKIKTIYATITADIIRVRRHLENRGIKYLIRGEPETPLGSGSKPQNKAGEPGINTGVPGSPNQLSDKQLAVALTLLNPFDRRSIETKLRELGVSPATYYGWMKSEIFSQYINRRAKELFGDTMPMAHAALMKNVISGDVKSLKLFYEMTGQWQGVRSNDVVNLRSAIAQLIEIIQRRIQDPDLLKSIAADFQFVLESANAAQTITGNPPVVMNGSVLNAGINEIES